MVEGVGYGRPSLFVAGVAIVVAACVEEGAWRSLGDDGAPVARMRHAAVWTGSEMILWGGHDEIGCVVGGGGIYDPSGDEWRSMSSDGAPGNTTSQAAFWVGSEMVIWAGGVATDGDEGCVAAAEPSSGRYDPVEDRWAPIAVEGSPTTRDAFAWAWTAHELVIWGGWDEGGQMLGDGARWNASEDRWTSIAAEDAPAPRRHASFTWTGRELLVWGGFDGQGLQFARFDGGRYDPASDTWAPITPEGAPDVPVGIGDSVWTGTRWLVWWVDDNEGEFAGFSYDPELDSWDRISGVAAPAIHGGDVTESCALWTGAQVLSWGASYEQGRNAIYTPSSDSWHPFDLESAPGNRYGHSCVWTGEEMILWGGHVASDDGHIVATGYSYEP